MNPKSFLPLILIGGGLAVSSCDDSPEKPGTGPKAEIAIEESSVELSVGESHLLSWTVKPEDAAVEWASSDEAVASVEDGLITALSDGLASIKATAGEASASCDVRVTRNVAVGDFYFSDGTFGQSVPAGKKAIGVVFWVGDPTAQDAALRRDHPNCTNGLVVSALLDFTPHQWQEARSAFNSSTGPWIEQNAKDYVSPVSEWGRDTRRNVIAGYNNTKALEAFNAAPENARWPVTALDGLSYYNEYSPAPESSSGWFIPGVKELTLLYDSEYDGDVFDLKNENELLLKNREVIDQSLRQIYGDPLWWEDGTWAYDIWSSTDWDNINAYKIGSNNGKIMGTYKDDTGGNQLVRCILAF